MQCSKKDATGLDQSTDHQPKGLHVSMAAGQDIVETSLTTGSQRQCIVEPHVLTLVGPRLARSPRVPGLISSM